jgi:dolichol-phosphate mannosyltransferase
MVGLAGAAVNSGLLFSFITFGRLDPVLAGGIATEIAILFNFSINDSWTFRGAPYRRAWPARAVRYNMVAAGGWCVSVGTLAVMIHLAHLAPLVANVFALGASFAVNYLANKHFTFVRANSAADSIAQAPASL